MVSVEIEIHDINALRKKLNKVGGILRNNIIGALRKSAGAVKRDAKTLTPVRTGKSRRSIRSSVMRKDLAAYVGSNWFVMRFIEGGTKKISARKPLEKAVRIKHDYIRKAIDKAIDGAIVKAGQA